MPTRKQYEIEITNTYTGEKHGYEVLSLEGCRDRINEHYGCQMITKNGVVNLIVRGRENSPKRFAGIHIVSKKPT